jgi:Mg-chelatase subunit ChlD
MLALGLPLVGALVVHEGCESSDETNGAGTGGGAAAGNSGTGAAAASGQGGMAGGAADGGAGGTAGQGGGTDAGVFDADFSYDAPYFDADLQDACVDETTSADPAPLDIYFMVDRSGSMTQPLGDNDPAGDCDVTWPAAPSVGTRWCNAINAIAGYIQDTTAQGNRAALEFFYSDINDERCTGYDVPAVGLVDLTGQASQIITAMNAEVPFHGTPTRPALEGLAAFTAANQAPGRIMIGILVTDGDPSTCVPTDNATMRGIIETHYNATGIHTFIVGITGATFDNLENWASYPGAISHPDNPGDTCGGSYSTCHHWNVGDGDPTAFIAALQQIQSAVLGCTFTVPQPSQGVLDPDTVSVQYDENGGLPPPTETLVRVTDATACSGADNEWHYDDNTTPTVIQLCPATCTQVESDGSAIIQVRIACQGS